MCFKLILFVVSVFPCKWSRLAKNVRRVIMKDDGKIILNVLKPIL